MKRWKMAAALILMLGLSAGTAVGAYAQEKELDNGNKAEGLWISDKREGPGRIYYKDGRVFEGFYVHDSLEGAGIIYQTDGARNIYSYYNNKANGLALKISKDGEAKASFYEDHKLKEDMELQSWELIDGTHYYAKAKTDIDGGKAIAVYKDGTIYVGDFKNGKRNGWGSCFYSNGSCHTGEWKDDAKDGVGYLSFSQDNSNLFMTGYWVKNKRQGGGYQYNKKNCTLVNIHKDGKAEGPAAYIKEDNSVTFCTYKEGKLSEDDSAGDVYTDDKGNRFLGVKDGKNGTGLEVTSKGIVYIGDFKDGQAEGNTLTYWPDTKVIFQGTVKAGMGVEGTVSWPHGSWYKGTFRDDEKNTKEKGIWRSLDKHYYYEGTLTPDNKFDTGNLTFFNKDGYSGVKKYKDTKLEN